MDRSRLLIAQHDDDDDNNDNAKEVLFLRAKIVEVAREGDTLEMKYLMSISAANQLLAAVDEVNSRLASKNTIVVSFAFDESGSVTPSLSKVPSILNQSQRPFEIAQLLNRRLCPITATSTHLSVYSYF